MGEVYNSLIDKINNNLIKIVQTYNISTNKNDYLIELKNTTLYLKFFIDNDHDRYHLIKICRYSNGKDWTTEWHYKTELVYQQI